MRRANRKVISSFAAWAMVAAACSSAKNPGGSSGFTVSGGGSSETETTSGTASTTMGSAGTVGPSTTSGATTSSGDTGAVSTMGSGTTQGVTTGGACAGPPFAVDVPNAWLDDVVVAGDRVIASGYTEGAGGRLFAFDPCDGTVLDERTIQYAGTTTGRLTRVNWVDDVLFTAGRSATNTDPGQGFYARIVPSTLQSQWEKPLFGSTGTDLVYDFVGSGTRIFLVGYSNLEQGIRPWIVQADTNGNACGFAWTPTPQSTGEVRAVAMGPGGVLAVAMAGGKATLLRYDPECACPCTPQAEFEISLGLGEDSVLFTSLQYEGNQVLASGVFYRDNDPVDLEAVVVSVSPLSGVVAAQWTKNVTPQGDGWLGADAAGGRLFVTGGTKWDGVSPDFIGASAWIAAFDLPLTNMSQPVWEAEPAGIDVLSGTDVDTVAGVVYVAGNKDGEGVFVACTTDGVCP